MTVRQHITARRRRKHRAAERLGVELALLGSLLFHLVLFYAFRIPPCVARQAPPGSEPDATLVSALGTPSPPGSSAAAWEKTILAWCVLADPTLMSLPNDYVGFGTVRQDERSLPVTEVPSYEYVVQLAAERPFPPIALTGPLPPVDREVADKWTSAKVRQRQPTPVAKLPSGLLWRRNDGSALPDVPQLEEARVRNAVAQGGVPVRATRLHIQRADRTGPVEITRREEFSRVRVQQSSGNPLLDGLAVSTLERELFRLGLEQKYRHIVETRSYLPEPGAEFTFEIEWRLMPAVAETAAKHGSPE